MRKQQQIWQNEHNQAKQLPSEMLMSSTIQPSGYVQKFTTFLQKKNILPTARIIDIGAGKGRNTIFLAKLGFDVFALDYIESAVKHIQQVAEKENLKKNIHAICAAADQVWPFANDFFDVAVDCFASIDIETRSGRETYKDELYRTLKPGGYALIVVVSTEDEIESELLQSSAGFEKNSTIWPESGKFQKDYDENELKEFYREFEVVSLAKIQKATHKLDRDFVATNFVLILRKGPSLE